MILTQLQCEDMKDNLSPLSLFSLSYSHTHTHIYTHTHTLTGRYTLGPGDGNLTISSALVSDSSTLTCEASNSAGSDDDTAQLRVISKQYWVFGPGCFAVLVGGLSNPTEP